MTLNNTDREMADKKAQEDRARMEADKAKGSEKPTSI